MAGARRLAAVVQLGFEEIEAQVSPASHFHDEVNVRLAEIKADMMRGELTALDHAVYVAAWCDIYRDAQDPRKRGPKKALPEGDEALDEFSAKLALNWTEAAQSALRIGRRTVFRSLKIAGIDRDITRRLALLPVADKQADLLLLADMTPVRQRAIVDILTAEPAQAMSVTEAIALLDSVPPSKPMPVYERLFQKFSSLKPAEQERFLDLNATTIELWIEKRRSAAARKAAA